MRIASEDATKQRRPLGGVESGTKENNTTFFSFSFWSEKNPKIQAVTARRLENSCMQGSIGAREAGALYPLASYVCTNTIAKRTV